MINKEKDIFRGGNKPFSTPEGYFDTFQDRLMERIDQKDYTIKSNEKTDIIRFLRPVLTMAASFAIIFMLIFIPIRMLDSQKLVQNEESNYIQPEYLSFYRVNDFAIIQAFEDHNDNDYDQQFLETVLLASMSEFELVHLNE